MLSASGIDTGMFGAHSTRSASASAARAAGVSIDTIMGTADWRQETTFRQFYDRQVRNTHTHIRIVLVVVCILFCCFPNCSKYILWYF